VYFFDARLYSGLDGSTFLVASGVEGILARVGVAASTDDVPEEEDGERK
jgi:hypothetical protein